MTLRLNLGKYLERHRISAYRVVKASKLAPNTVYLLARQPAQRIDLDTVSAVLAGLETITGQPVQISDLIEDVDGSPTQGNTKLAALLKTAKPPLTLEAMRGPKMSKLERESFARAVQSVRDEERNDQNPTGLTPRERRALEGMTGKKQ